LLFNASLNVSFVVTFSISTYSRQFRTAFPENDRTDCTSNSSIRESSPTNEEISFKQAGSSFGEYPRFPPQYYKLQEFLILEQDSNQLIELMFIPSVSISFIHRSLAIFFRSSVLDRCLGRLFDCSSLSSILLA